MLETQDVYTLVQRFHEHESNQASFTGNDSNQAWPCQARPLTVWVPSIVLHAASRRP